MAQRGLILFFFFTVGLWTVDGVLAFRAGATGSAWVETPPFFYTIGCGWGGWDCSETLIVTMPGRDG